MTDLKFTSPSGETTIKVQDTGRLGTIAPKTQLHIRKTPMTETEKIKAQIKVLEKKLSFLEELSKTKTPYEEGYKKVFGYYPVTDIGDAYWEYFQKGYEQAQKDYKVGEFQEPEKEPVPLYKRFVDESAYGQLYYDDAIKVVNEFLMDEGVIEDESGEYITFTLQKSLLEVPND
jgi:hypothetical protein